MSLQNDKTLQRQNSIKMIMPDFVLVPSGRNVCSKTTARPKEFKPHRGDMVRFTMPLR